MDEEAVSPVIGVVLMVAVTVVLAAAVFWIVSDLDVAEPPPMIAFRSSGDGYVVQSAPQDLEWADLAVDGCDTVPTGPVTAGDRLGACTEPVTVVHTPTNSLVWSS